ncbi:MAG: GNAT family N-acetyltransferase [Chloroflexota bacterium]|nr:GNAT family N-acetyltransferase [Chloroflexota bacterium]
MAVDSTEQPALPRPEIINVEGNLVALGPIRRDLVPRYQRWMNDLATTQNLGAAPAPITLEAETAWFERTAGGAASDVVIFTVYERRTWRPIGNADLRQIDHRNRSAAFGIVIGEASCRGKGYGTETVRLMLDIAFTGLSLHNVMLTVFEFNPAGRRAYEKAGFKEIGRRRQCRWLAGRWWDEIYMDCLATEFESPVLGKLLAPVGVRTS